MHARAKYVASLAAALVLACGATHDATPTLPAVEGGAAGAGAAGAGAAGAGATNSAAGLPSIVDAGGQGGAPSAMGGAAGAVAAGATAMAGAAGASDDPCSGAALEGLEVYSQGIWDPLGYPPYALDGCTLAYVAVSSGAENGGLRLRDLATGEELELEAGAARPRRPAVAGGVVAWESDGPDGSQVRVRDASLTEPFEMAFQHAGEPRVTTDAVVFTAFLGVGASADTDVELYDLTRRVLTPIATGPGQQRFADVSAKYVAVTDFAEDPKGYFDETGSISDIVLFARDTLERTARAAPGKQAFPLLGNDGLIAYLEWGAVHPEPKFSQFFLKAGYVDGPVTSDRNVKGGELMVVTDPAYVRPSLHGQYLDFIDKGTAAPQLFRADLAAAAPPVAATIAGASRLLGPVAADTMTLVAQPLQGATLQLVAVAR